MVLKNSFNAVRCDILFVHTHFDLTADIVFTNKFIAVSVTAVTSRFIVVNRDFIKKNSMRSLTQNTTDNRLHVAKWYM